MTVLQASALHPAFSTLTFECFNEAPGVTLDYTYPTPVVDNRFGLTSREMLEDHIRGPPAILSLWR